MFTSVLATVLAASSVVSAAAVRRGATTVSVTPHDSYSSSVGVLGCKINTNQVVYWPWPVDCDNICVKVTNEDRSLYLLHVDQSGGAFDMSYEAWVGGGVNMQYENVPASYCSGLLDDGKLPLSASNSMNYLASCLAQPSSWVAGNYQLFNVLDSQCHWGYNETCTLDLSVSNQPTCKHQLGVPVATVGLNVTNIQYATGLEVSA
ncbi:hypothetical protein ESCO_003434 [Escovopsis weberi]|uniref:Cerato-platanin n=1 Tax=Escovopsis weberi TaxID=150374 RepID=A0A0M8N8D3_ESCWE|nr:hypothetical protein ESCO_003434 [Escovopsis weberi]